MFTVNWQYIGEDNELKTETLYEASTVRVLSYTTKHNTPLNIEIISLGWGTFHVTPHGEFHQRIYVMNDVGKTVRTYDVGKMSSNGGES